MTYYTLLRIQWTRFVRSMRSAQTRPISLGQVLLGLYAAGVLVCAGLFFKRLFGSNHLPTHLFNKHLFANLTALISLRFFFQRPPRLNLQRYLHLPVNRSRLVHYFQIASLASIYNVLPFFFLIPFGLRYLPASLHPSSGIILWIAGITLAILTTHYLNTALRLYLDRDVVSFLLLFAIAIGIHVIDQFAATHPLSFASARLFDRLLDGDAVPLFLLAAVCGATYLISSIGLHRKLRGDGHGLRMRNQVLPVSLPFGTGLLNNLVLLELKMMWRNQRAKQYVLISIVVSTAYTGLLLSDLNVFASERWMWALTGLFASGAFVLNYGQLMFAWESRHFDGMLAEPIPLAQMILAKFMLLQGSCVILFLISLPLFAWLAPGLLPLHVAFLLYNAGVTSALMLLLAVQNRKRVDLTHGGFFRYQGFSALHWFWMLPTAVPPMLVLLLFPASPSTAFSMIAALGLGGLLLAWPWSQLLARWLTHRKHEMATGFRMHTS